MNEHRESLERVWRLLLERTESTSDSPAPPTDPPARDIDPATLHQAELLAALLAVLNPHEPEPPEITQLPKTLQGQIRKLRAQHLEQRLQKWMSDLDRDDAAEPIHLEPVPDDMEAELRAALDHKNYGLSESDLRAILMDIMQDESGEAVSAGPVRLPVSSPVVEQPQKRRRFPLHAAIVLFAFVGLASLYWELFSTHSTFKKELSVERYDAVSPDASNAPESEVLQDVQKINSLEGSEGDEIQLGQRLREVEEAVPEAKLSPARRAAGREKSAGDVIRHSQTGVQTDLKRGVPVVPPGWYESQKDGAVFFNTIDDLKSSEERVLSHDAVKAAPNIPASYSSGGMGMGGSDLYSAGSLMMGVTAVETLGRAVSEVTTAATATIVPVSGEQSN